jgi:glutaredoxin
MNMNIELFVIFMAGFAFWFILENFRKEPQQDLWAGVETESKAEHGVKMFMTENCPHCKKAFSLMEEICREHPEYKAIKIKKIDESKRPDYAAKFDYHFVPTFYVGSKKMHEGSPTKEALEKVYAEALRWKK